MNYEEMSDFQINKAVSEAMGISTVRYPHAADKRSVGVRNSDTNYEWFDYCNNPSDAWPIITGSKIGFVPVNGLWRASSVTAGYHECSNDNPLRAAMIVFLMIKDSECQKP